jgi:flavin-dependent dehydrogenase
MKNHYDCIVIGAGPAGSTAAALVAEAGCSTLLVERERVPRFHIGESLMPETYWTLQRLGVLERMKSSPFIKKLSVQFVSASGKESQPFFFRDHDPRECAETWQVERADFDKLLFDNAAEKGADCRDRTRVLSVDFEDRRATGVTLQTDDGTQHRGLVTRDHRCHGPASLDRQRAGHPRGRSALAQVGHLGILPQRPA